MMPDEAQTEYKVNADVYSVDKGGYEYRVKLLNEENHEVVDDWDSLHECFNGSGHLTEANAKATIQNIKDDVQDGKAHLWFDVEDD